MRFLIAAAAVCSWSMLCQSQEVLPESPAEDAQNGLAAGASLFEELWDEVIQGFSAILEDADSAPIAEPSVLPGPEETLRQLLRKAHERGYTAIVRDNVKNLPWQLTEEHFGHLDRNHDGVLSRADLSSF